MPVDTKNTERAGAGLFSREGATTNVYYESSQYVMKTCHNIEYSIRGRMDGPFVEVTFEYWMEAYAEHLTITDDTCFRQID
ncbi:17245_t:CDS:1, partial [Acaulospora colombiana]